jgi:hypothetical protein
MDKTKTMIVNTEKRGKRAEKRTSSMLLITEIVLFIYLFLIREFSFGVILSNVFVFVLIISLLYSYKKNKNNVFNLIMLLFYFSTFIYFIYTLFFVNTTSEFIGSNGIGAVPISSGLLMCLLLLPLPGLIYFSLKDIYKKPILANKGNGHPLSFLKFFAIIFSILIAILLLFIVFSFIEIS